MSNFKLFPFCLFFVTLISCAQKHKTEIQHQTNHSKKESAQWWFEQGEKRVQQLQSQTFPKNAKNIILIIGDGMSIGTITAARILEGQKLGLSGEEHQLSFDKFPQTALSKTYNTNLQTPDSAGTMTAMMTGVKTKGGIIAMDGDVLNRDCNSGKGHELLTFLELAEQANMPTGIVTTAKVTHATPAATYAHSVSRGWESDSDIPKEERQKGCKDIAQQLIDFPYGDGIEVVLGGGRAKFLPKQTVDPEYKDMKGERDDNQNLLKAWEAKYTDAKSIWSLDEFNEIDTRSIKHLLGVFQPSHMQYEQDRLNDIAGEPSLTTMSLKALEILKNHEKPYFLMIESGRIDHGHHAGSAHRALIETIELSNTVKAITEQVDLNETLIIVTADHSHTMSISGYPQRGNPILGLVKVPNQKGELVASLAKDSNDKPYTTLNYANGPGYVNDENRPDLTHVDVHSPNYRQEALFPLESETHSGEDVVIYATGAGSHLVKGTIEQNVIFHIMLEAAKNSLKSIN